ncbi:MAG: O-antigen polymerase [Cycloclasticus sp.]|nr:MAG: O-antigen polymerase [Cycloclasticus sp.]
MTFTHSKSSQLLANAALVLLVWVTLPLGSNRPWSAMLFVMLVSMLSGVWAWMACRQPAHKASQKQVFTLAKPLFVLLLVTQLWVCVQWLMGLSEDSARTFYYLLLGCAYCLLYLLIVNLFTTRKRLTLLLSTLIISGAFQGFYGSLMTLSGIEWGFFVEKEHYRGLATGTFVNRNHLAGYLEMTIACSIGLLLAFRTGQALTLRNTIELLMGPKVKIRLALLMMVIALVLTHSRMGNTAFFSSLLLVGGLFVLTNKRHRKRNSLIFISIILIDLLVISQYFGLDQLKERLVNTRISDQVVNGEVVQKDNIVRDDIVVSALPMIKQRPFVGYGAGSFESTYQQYAGDHIRIHLDHAHNDYVQFLVEFGLIGFVPLLLFVLMSLWHAFQALRMRESWYRSGVGFAASMGIMSILIHSFTDFNLQIPANAATFIVLCAIAVLARTHVKE